MRIRLLAAIFLAASSALAVAARPVHHHAAQRNVRHRTTRASYSRSRSSHTAAMDSGRATQIQSALIKQGYLTGQPSGAWDARTIAAMQKLQGDNGWQTRMTPDARALNKLGLGSKDAAPPPQ